MNLTDYEIEKLGKKLKVDIKKNDDTFELEIENYGLNFNIRIETSPFYFYAYLEFEGFYLIQTKDLSKIESKEMILEELFNSINLFKNSRFQVFIEKKFFKSRVGLKIYEEGNWIVFSKPSKRIEFS